MLRFSIAKVMGLVGLVALNFAVARILFAYRSELLIGVILGMLSLQIGLFQMVSSRGRSQAFWLGSIVCGLLLMMTFVWAMLFPEVLGITSTGALQRTPGSAMYAIWHGYASQPFVDDKSCTIFDAWLACPSTVSRALL